MISVSLRPNRSEIQPITPRPVPLTIAFRDIAVATIPPAKPISLPNGTCMAMPKMLMPAVHSRHEPHQRQDAGLERLHRGVLLDRRRVLLQRAADPRVVGDLQRVDVRRPPVLRRVLEEAAGHRDQPARKMPTARQDALVVGQVHVAGEEEDERHRAVGETAVDEARLAALPFRDTTCRPCSRRSRRRTRRRIPPKKPKPRYATQDVRRVRQRQIAEKAPGGAEHHRRAGRQPAALPQLAGREGHRRLEEHPDAQQPEDVGAVSSRVPPRACPRRR